MILRVRKADGSTVRAQGSLMDSLLAVLVDGGVVSEEDVKAGVQAFRDIKRVADELAMDMSLSDLRLDHGDFVYLKGGVPPAPAEASSGSVNTGKAAADGNGVHDAAGSESKSAEKYQKWGPKMVNAATLVETKEDRLRQALRDVWTGGGMSVAVNQALEAFRYVIKRQEEGRTTLAMVDSKAAFEFQSYLATIGFQQQRCGILYGSAEDDKTYVTTIYEPPQEGTDKIFKMQTDAGAERLNARAATIAKQLGIKPVGLIFSHKMRTAILSGYDVVTAAKAIADMEDEFGEDVAKYAVVLTVSPNEDGSIQFNSYQLSDQCIEMYRKGVFAPPDQQRRNSGKVKTHPEGWLLYEDKKGKRSFKHDKVLVEKKETDLIPTEFFLINVAIQSHTGWLQTNFPVENREIAPQMIEDLTRNLNDKDESRFVRRISDFHLLNFLAGLVDLTSELPGLLEMVKERRDPTAQENGYQIILESLIN